MIGRVGRLLVTTQRGIKVTPFQKEVYKKLSAELSKPKGKKLLREINSEKMFDFYSSLGAGDIFCNMNNSGDVTLALKRVHSLSGTRYTVLGNNGGYLESLIKSTDNIKEKVATFVSNCIKHVNEK